MSRPSLILISFLVVLAFGILMVEAEEREKRAPILGLLLAKKVLLGKGLGHHRGGHHHGGHGGHGYGGHGGHHGGHGYHH
ncbi:glycine-rich cell wall structural protein [Daphnia magna]|uniref:Uncharacterized protein n=1 Tax=Daphnia magna TaxID=35525 RepID=A0ABQ9YZB2_9CRUS|nr:glycine-rich cell wall structural protein [Daphnia magna]KAK4005986.1 hypothetical protein OUZ56_011118 [Daphnia magna]